MNMALSAREGSGPKTFARGLHILDALFKAGDEGLKVTEIAALTQIQRPTVYRFLDVMVEQGFATEAESSRKYVFNYQRLTRGTGLADTVERLKPVLQRISAQTGDSSFLIRRDGGDSLCVHREVGSYPVQVLAVTIGHRQPLGVGAAGLALLSHLAAQDIEIVLTGNEGLLPHYGGMTVAQMRRLIKSTQERGWSAVGNSAVPGVLGVGVPILRPEGQPLFAVSVSSILDRMPVARQRFIIEVIRRELNAAHVQYAI
jgi:DNA-binding IclR family transcriptional regulator